MSTGGNADSKHVQVLARPEVFELRSTCCQK